MTDRTREAEQFRALHIPGKPFILFNIWDAGGAKAAIKRGQPTRPNEIAGFSALPSP
jgi:2-methylisocitrate lyase-like PEP mutase family enzyme